MFRGKPIIGVAGGIGSGKSFVAGLFAQSGCRAIDSDAHVRELYGQQRVKDALRSWWGGEVFRGEEVDRAAVGRLIFADPAQRLRLERLLHPLAEERRLAEMESAAYDAGVKAFVWDIPLLFETGLNRQCDAVVFVDCPRELRLDRIQKARGWDAEELLRRENSQAPLDNKRQMSDYVVRNTADASYVRSQVSAVLSRILDGLPGRPEGLSSPER